MGSQQPRSGIKIVSALRPDDYGSTAPNATQCLNIDTLGFRWAVFSVDVGNVAGTSITAIVQQDDNSAMSSATSVTGATMTVWGNTSDNTQRSITIDLSKTERYLQLAFTYDTISASDVSAVCVLSGAHDSAYIGTNGVDAQNEGVFPA